MKITRIIAKQVLVPVKPQKLMITALGQHRVSKYVIVRVETDAGIDGAGEATVAPLWSGETVWGCQALIDHVLTPVLIGADPTDIAGIDAIMDRATQDNWFAKSAIEMACWDIKGKDAGKPVYELLGGAVRPLAVRSRFSLAAYATERARTRAQELVDEGFTTIKVKVGTGSTDADVERVHAVREVIGPKLALTIDANCGYSVEAAIDAAHRMEPDNVCLFEQPTPRGDFEGLATVRKAVKPVIMADDMAFDLSDAKNLAHFKACDLISIYPGKNGGIRKSKEIVEYAAKHGMACSIGSNLELDVCTAAMAHLVVACENMQVEKYPGDMLGPGYHEFPIVKDPIDIKGPFTTITDKPGLGVEVDWAVIEKNPVT